MKLEDWNDFLDRYRIQNYDHITQRIHNKSGNKAAILAVVYGGIRHFRKDHPGVLEGSWQQSLGKRIGGCIYSWLYNDVKLKELFVLKERLRNTKVKDEKDLKHDKSDKV